ncbi:aldehyde dehydrogenase [Marinomonas sp. 5E14-1]|uniref:aldehyde dehydrogenase n=1 Tax=Marinomonas sp. 5E14-1 TaxID=3153922 RepID=UPI00326500E3
MSNLLTLQEYQAIAGSLTLPTMSFIDGKFRPAALGKTFATVNPATGDHLADISACAKEDVDFAVEKARESFDDGRWSQLHPNERKKVLLKLSKLVLRNRHELAVMESLDSGKPIADCENLDIEEFIHIMNWHAELADKIYDQTAPVGNDAMSMIVREPVGVVGAVLPWNFPLLMLVWKIAPALSAGCSMVIKPAEQTSLTALRIAELASEAGLPRGVLNIVTGGAETGESLGLHMDVDMITFTGSTVTGRRFLRYSADSNMKKIVLELGGKNPCIVLDDAENIDYVAQQVCAAAFWNMGENCSAASRLIVQAGIKDKLLERVKAHSREWRVGNPLDPQNALGAMIDSGHFSKVTSFLEKGKQAGYDVLIGGDTMDGTYIQPTIFDGVANSDELAREEIFGPVLSVITVNSYEEALQVANDTEYGLAASVFTANAKKAIRAAKEIKAGTVTVNCFGEGDVTTPFGGYKQSGFGGRDNSIHAHDQYTELKTVWIDLSDHVVDGAID